MFGGSIRHENERVERHCSVWGKTDYASVGEKKFIGIHLSKTGSKKMPHRQHEWSLRNERHYNVIVFSSWLIVYVVVCKILTESTKTPH